MQTQADAIVRKIYETSASRLLLVVAATTSDGASVLVLKSTRKKDLLHRNPNVSHAHAIGRGRNKMRKAAA